MADDTRCDRCGKPWMWAGKGKFSIGTPKTHWCDPCCKEQAVIEAAKPIVELVEYLAGDYPLKGQNWKDFERFRKAVYAFFGKPENLCMCDECVSARALDSEEG